MQTHLWKKVVRLVVRSSMIALLGASFVGGKPGMQGEEAHALAHSACADRDRLYVVVGGDTLGTIAARYAVDGASLAAYSRIAHPNLIYAGQRICIPGHRLANYAIIGTASRAQITQRLQVLSHLSATHLALYHVPALHAVHPWPAGGAEIGARNAFPYGACTWWANQRYHQLHGVFVPWQTNANAWQWARRASEFGWRISGSPRVGDIIDLQPGVQGAYDLGHVAVVERVLTDGHVIASSMSWGKHPWSVTQFQFVPGPGVAFISM